MEIFKSAAKVENAVLGAKFSVKTQFLTWFLVTTLHTMKILGMLIYSNST